MNRGKARSDPNAFITSFSFTPGAGRGMFVPMSSVTLNPNLATLPVYVPGRPIDEVARQVGLDPSSIIKVASNENPLGPSPKALAAMEKVLKNLHLYPDGSAFHLKRRLAAHLNVTPEHLILGSGSNEIIEFLGHALLTPGSEVVVSQHCFAVYPIVAALFGAKLVTVPANGFAADIPAMIRAITPNTKLLFLANPNNPTGTLTPRQTILDLIAQVPSHVMIAMDEAYVEFLEDAADCLGLIRAGKHPNLMVMRTFSKIFGLAGLRLGYGVGSPEFIAALEKVRQPFNINSIALAGAEAALEDVEHLQRTRENNRRGLDQIQSEFQALGLEYVESHANFVLVRVGDGAGVFAGLQKLGVITRPMGSYQLPEWIRVSVGTQAENERFLGALKQVLKR